MSRRPIAVAAVAVLALTLAAPVLLAAKAKKEPPAELKEPISETASFTSTGEIVDCSDYLFFGKKGNDRRTIQAAHLDAGMPACFIADVDKDVYLLLQPEGQVKEKFQPTENFIGGDVTIIGVVYQKGSLKALSIDSIARLGTYSDRQSRRIKNPEPNRKQDVKDPKKPDIPQP